MPWPCPCSCSACPDCPAQRPAPAAQRAPSAPAPAQRPGCSRRSPAPAPGPALVRTVSHRPKYRYRGSTFNPPYTDMHGPHPTSKISSMTFVNQENPGRTHPPRLFLAQKFSHEKILWRPCVCPDMACERVDIEKPKQATETKAIRVVAEELGLPFRTVQTWVRRNKHDSNESKKARIPDVYDTRAILDLQTLIDAGEKFGTICSPPPGRRDQNVLTGTVVSTFAHLCIRGGSLGKFFRGVAFR